jgi:hypothetical protein
VKEHTVMNGLIRFVGIFTLAVGLAAPALAVETGRHQRLGGIDIYYGIVPAQVVGSHPPGHEEKSMHGGPSAKKAGYHLVVTLLDADGQRVTDAEVTATVGELGMAGTRRKLETMRIDDTTSFGNYLELRGAGPYRIAIEVRRPGEARPIEATFDYRLS